MNMFKSVLLVTVLLLWLTPQGVRAQTVDGIIAKYMDALGGKEKLLSIKTIYQEGVAVMQNGMEVDSKLYRVNGKLFRDEISFGMGNVVIIVTPTQGWSENPRTGGTFEAMKDEQVKALQSQLDCPGPLVDYAAKGNKVELQGKDTVNGKECYKLKLTFPSGNDVTYSIDAASYYLLRESRKGGGMFGGGGGAGAGGGTGAGGGAGGGGRRGGNANGEMNVDFSDYQKTADGYVFPMTIVSGNFGAKTSVEKLDINKPIDDAKLSKPQ